MKKFLPFTKQTILSSILFFIVLTSQFSIQAANYYWRATAVNNLFTNIGNWETAPGGGVSPSTAPSATDDVFFPVTSTQSNIVFNNGNCRNFTFTAPSAFTFTGTLTTLSGNLSCNGNATLGTSASTVLNFTSTGAKTIDIGTTVNKVFASLNFATVGGSYSLLSDLNSSGFFAVSGPSFSTNGKVFSYSSFAVTGATAKTIDFSNSLVTCLRNNTNGGGATTNFTSSSTTTAYNLTGTRLVIQNDFTGTNEVIANLTLGAGVSINLDSLILNSATTGINKETLGLNGSSGSPCTITANVLKINTGNINVAFTGSGTGAANNFAVLNIAKLVYARPNIIYNNQTTTINIGSGGITEPVACGRAVIMNNTGTLNYNVSPAITTTNTDYYGVTFGGGGIAASASSNFGLNTGAVSWLAAASGISYWWVGGTGNWNDPTHWSIIGSGAAGQSASGCLPTLQDNVFFDANSFTGNQTVTIPNGGDAYCKNLDWSAGSNQGLLAGPNSAYPSNLIINGNANFTKARGVTTPLLFIGSGNHTITSGTFFTYQSMYVRFQGSGTYTLGDNFLTSLAVFQHRAGTLNTAGFRMEGNNFLTTSLPQIPANPRSLIITNSDINLQGDSYIDVSFLTVLNAGNSNIKSTSLSPAFTITRNDPSASFLNTVNLHNISFTNTLSSTGVATWGSGYTASFNDVSFAGDGSITNPGNISSFTVNNYNLSSGKTYTFQSARTFNIITGINTTLSGCQDLLIINASIAGTQAKINKATAPFIVNGAVVQDINSTGATMTITSGLNSGNNTNVTVGASLGRTMYWVGNAGNWSDGVNHWSIGISGGIPATTNPLGCVPRIIDSVVFDNNSFTLASQTVTLDATANCKGMLWTAAAGANTPRLTGASTVDVNNYGSLELGTGMTSPFNGSIHLLGQNMTANSNYIDLNGVTLSSNLYLEGGGTYDVLDSLTILGRFTLFSGNLYTHSYKITAAFLNFTIGAGFTGDISNSFLTASTNTYVASHAAGSTWNAPGSTISVGGSSTSIANNTGSPLNYANIIMTYTASTTIATNATIATNFKKIQFKNTSGANTTTLNGVILTDTLQYAPNTTNLLTPGGSRTYTVNDTLIAYGTPCTPSYLRSTVLGTPAILKITRCNLDLNFVSVRDINVSTCTTAQNKDIGTDEGGNTNFSFTSIAGLTNLGADTTVLCKDIPFTQGTAGFGMIPGITYLWGGGQTTNTLPVSNSNTYSVAVTYAAGCVINDNRTITVGSAPPVALALGYEQVSPAYCTTSNYDYYEGAAITSSFNKSIMAIKANGNTITPTIKVNNEGNLGAGTSTGTFSNTGAGYYQCTDGTNTIRITKRLHSIIAPGTYTVNGGVIVRIYYTAADIANMSADPWLGGGLTSNFGWFKQVNHTAQGVIDSLKPGTLGGSAPLTPIATGIEGGVNYAEFKLTSFSTIGYFVSTVPMALLPVKLLSFNAQKTNNNQALLTWQTTSEQNSSHFEIQQSTNGVNWQPAGRVIAAGNSSTLRSYQFIHTNPVAGINYYRLKAADTDGKFGYSTVQLLRMNGASAITVLPNPVTDRVFIKSNTAVKALQLFDVAGKLIWQTNHFTNGESVNMAGYTNGIYQLRIEMTNGNAEVHKLMKR